MVRISIKSVERTYESEYRNFEEVILTHRVEITMVFQDRVRIYIPSNGTTIEVNGMVRCRTKTIGDRIFINIQVTQYDFGHSCGCYEIEISYRKGSFDEDVILTIPCQEEW